MMHILPLLAEVAASAAAPVTATPDAAPAAAEAGTNWLGFLGHFHPLLLHLPIGLITGVLFLELAALWRARKHGKHAGQVVWFEESRPYVGLAAWLLAASGAAAAFAGYFWRLSGADDGSVALSEDLHDHQVLGFWVAGGCVLAAILHAVAVKLKNRGVLWAFRIILLATAGLLAPTGHVGGQLVHGSSFLSEYAPKWMPAFVVDLLGKADAKEAVPASAKKDETVFGVAVKPILDARCVSCHNTEKKKGGLQLHNMEGILKGGNDTKGTVVVAGKPDESELLTVIHAPLDDEEHMPPKAKPQPTVDEIAVLAWWIQSGARFDVKFDAKAAPAEVAKALATVGQIAPSAGREAAVAGSQAPAPSAAAVAALRAKQVAVQPLAQGSNLLWIDFAAPAAKTTDADMALLAPLTPNVAQLGLGRAKITDAGLDAVAKLASLETLDLRSTGVTDAGLAKLAGLKSLSHLNLVNTGITDAGLEKLATLPGLTKLYVWGTKTTPEGIAKLKAAFPKLALDNGTTPDAAVLPDPNAPVNKLCPVTGNPINPAFTTMFQGKTIGFCDAASKAKFEAALKAEEPKPAEKPAEAKPVAVDPKPINTICPVSGKPVDVTKTLVFEGKTIAFCCGNCPKAFQADPAKYKANIKADAAAPAVAAKPVNTVCPVSGKPVDPAHTVVFEGKTIGFCCGNCPKAFQADPAKYKASIK